mgnify:CR=1 FL=1
MQPNRWEPDSALGDPSETSPAREDFPVALGDTSGTSQGGGISGLQSDTGGRASPEPPGIPGLQSGAGGTELLRTVEDLPTICPSEPPGIPPLPERPLRVQGSGIPRNLRTFPQLGRLPRPPKVSRRLSGFPGTSPESLRPTPSGSRGFPVALGDTSGTSQGGGISGLQSRVLREESLRALGLFRPPSASFGFPASSCFPGRSPGGGASGSSERVSG